MIFSMISWPSVATIWASSSEWGTPFFDEYWPALKILIGIILGFFVLLFLVSLFRMFLNR
jgi:hypothetical protein